MLLITGATGLVGSHVAQRARAAGMRTRALVRGPDASGWLQQLGVEMVEGELANPQSLSRATAGVTLIVHCAAKIGDWGPVADYRDVNVIGLQNLLSAAEADDTLRRFVHISSLAVYEGRDHHGTDETTLIDQTGADSHTQTKIEAEQLVQRHIRERQIPATVLRPGFVYGPRDRTALPQLLERLANGQVQYLGSGEQLMSNTFVLNLVDVIFSVLDQPAAIGQTYNITDGALVSKRDFISTVATMAGLAVPQAALPLKAARMLATISEQAYRMLRRTQAPTHSRASYRFLGQNLEFSIEKAKRELGYQPRFTFEQGMQQTIDWFRAQGKLPAAHSAHSR